METTSFGAIREIMIFFLKTQSKLLPQYKNLAVYLLLLSNTSQEILSDITSSFSDFIPPSWERKKKKKAYLSTSSEQTRSELEEEKIMIICC